MMKKIISITCFISLMITQDLDPVFTGAFGSATINNKIYNQVSIRPEFSFSKFAVGLDVYFYFDENGNLYNENWDFSSSERSFKTLVDKIYYIRWGQEDDPLYFRIGALPTITLGHGSLVNSYSNVTDYPRIRRNGFNLKKQFNNYNLEVIHSNLKNIFEPAIFGIGNTLSFSNDLMLSIVAVTDLNQHKGLIDTDGDGVPDYLETGFEDNPNQWYEEQFFIEENSLCEDQNSLGWLDNIGLESEIEGTCSDGVSQNQAECESADGNWVGNPLGNDINDFCDYTVSDGYRELIVDYNKLNKNDNVSGLSLGLSYDLSNTMMLYTEFSQLIGKTKNPYSNNPNFDTNLGYGFIPIGVKVDFNILSLAVDFRQNSKNFIFNYWDRNYDHSRITTYSSKDDNDNFNTSLITKESELYNYGESNGMHFTISSGALKFLNISLSYQHLNSDMWNAQLEKYESDTNKSLYAKLDIDTSMIEKVRIAEVFYQKSNVDDVFNSSSDENSLFGYNLGLQMADNMVFLLKGRKTYIQNEFGEYEPVKTTQFESQIIF